MTTMEPITHIKFRTCDRENSYGVDYKPKEPMTGEEALEYILHWALELITDFEINEKTTVYSLFAKTIKEERHELQRKEKNC